MGDNAQATHSQKQKIHISFITSDFPVIFKIGQDSKNLDK